MQLPESFEDAKKHYFGIRCKRDRERGQQLLLALWETSEDKLIKAKSAYFLGVIHLTDLIRGSFTLTTTADNLSEAQKRILSTGLEWLKRSHQFGYETASLLLARMHDAPNQEEFDTIQIDIDGNKLTSNPVYARELFSPVYSANLLVPISNTNQRAALLLGIYAREWLKLMENIILKDSPIYMQYDQKLARIVQRPLAFYPPEQEYDLIASIFLDKFVKDFGDLDEVTEETDLEFMRDEAEKFIIKAEAFSRRGVLAAIELMRDVFSGEWSFCHLVSDVFTKDIDKAIQLQQQVWDIRLGKTIVALQWLENAKKLGCSNHVSEYRLGLFCLSQVYLVQRKEGLTHEEARESYDCAVKEVRRRNTAAHEARANTAFFTTPDVTQQAQTLLQQNNFELAVVRFRKAIGILAKNNPDSEEMADCHRGLALCYIETHDFEFAASACEQALKIYKNLRLTQKYKDVVKIYKRTLETTIPLVEKIFIVALKLMEEKEKNYDKAKIFFKYVLTHTNDTGILRCAALNLDTCNDKLIEEQENQKTGPQSS